MPKNTRKIPTEHLTGLLNEALQEVAKLKETLPRPAEYVPTGPDSSQLTKSDAWFDSLTNEEKQQLKVISNANQIRLASQVVAHLLKLRAASGRPDYQQMLIKTRNEWDKTRNLEKRAMLRTSIAPEHRLLSQQVQAAHRFFSHISALKNPIPKDSFGTHIGY